MLDMEAAESASQLGIALGDQLSELTRQITDNLTHQQDLFHPLKELAFAIAEQIARAELNHNSDVIRRFIERNIAEIDPVHLNELVLHLPRQWYEQLQQEPLASVFGEYTLRADDSLEVGSIRLSINDSSIEDLLSRRLEILAQQLYQPVPLAAQSEPVVRDNDAGGLVIDADFDDLADTSPAELGADISAASDANLDAAAPLDSDAEQANPWRDEENIFAEEAEVDDIFFEKPDEPAQ